MRYFALFWKNKLEFNYFKNSIDIMNAFHGMPVFDSTTLHINLLDYNDFIASETDIDKDDRNYGTYDHNYDWGKHRIMHLINSKMGFYGTPVRRLFIESVSNVVREYQNDFIVINANGTDLFFWCEYKTLFCNDVPIFEMDFCTEALWIRENPILFVYRPANGILTVKLGIVSKRLDEDKDRNIDLLICINENDRKVISVYNYSKDKLLFCTNIIGDDYIKKLSGENYIFHEVHQNNICLFESW